MAETTREMVVRLTMDAGGFKKTATEINRQIKNIDSEIKGMGGEKTPGAKSKLEEKLGLQQKAVENLQKAVEDARKKLNEADTDAKKLLAAKQLSGLETQLANAEAKAQALKNQLSAASLIKFGTLATNFGKSMKRMGRTMSLYVSGPLMALGGKAYKTALDFESATVSMQKTIDETDTTKYADIEAAFKSLSETAPVGYTELMELAGQAGALGVGADQVVEFVKSVAMISETADDLDASTGADVLARFLNVTDQGSFENITRTASAVTALGNNLATTEGELMAMAQRMASTGELAGMSNEAILALAAGFTSVGINAEAGGSAAGKLMKKMQSAAELGSKSMVEFSTYSETAGQSARDLQLAADNSKWVTKTAEDLGKTKQEVKDMIDSMVMLEQFSGVMDVTPTQFIAGWDANAGQSIIDFFNGLNKIEAGQGEDSVLSKLNEMGLTEIRLSNLVASAATNPELFKNALAISDEAYKANIALSEEAEKRYATAESRQQTQLNVMENAAADVGENVVDMAQPLIETVTRLVGEFGKLDEATQDNWVKVAGALLLLGPAAMGIGSVADSVGKMAGFLGKLDDNGVSRWTKISDFLTGPIGGPLAAAVAVGGSVYLLDQYMSSISDNTVNVLDRLKNIEIGLDEKKYKAVSDALAEIQAQADALSGENGEYNKNVSTAVQAGYGTESMFGTAIGYEALMSEQDMAAIAGRYGDQINKLNGMIGEASRESDRKALAAERDALQAQWDTDVSNAKQRYADKVSALVGGMMQAEPEAKAALEQAARDYDVLAALSKAMSDVMAADITPEESDQVWENFFTPEILGQYFEGLKYEDLVPGAAALDLENKLVKGLTETLEKSGGENSMINSLFQAILDNPLTASSLDLTKASGSLDGIVELLDFKAASEKLGTDYGNGLTDGFADSITTGTVSVTTAATGMAEAADEAVRARLGMHSPSTVMIGHGINTATSWAMGIELGAPITTAAMTNLGAALTAIAAAQGKAAGSAYGSAFSSAASIQLNASMAKIKRELDNMNIRINRGFGV